MKISKILLLTGACAMLPLSVHGMKYNPLEINNENQRKQKAEKYYIDGSKYYIAKEYDESFQCFLISANLGNDNSIKILKWSNVNDSNKDKKAISWYVSISDKNKKDRTWLQKEALLQLGNYYLFYGDENIHKAPLFYSEAAISNHVMAQLSLAYCYHFGFGTQANISSAIHWYQAAADNGDKIAQQTLQRLSNKYPEYFYAVSNH